MQSCPNVDVMRHRFLFTDQCAKYKVCVQPIDRKRVCKVYDTVLRRVLFSLTVPKLTSTKVEEAKS